MIVITGNGAAGAGGIQQAAGWPDAERRIYELKQKSAVTYVYPSVQQVWFEMTLRAKIVAAARELQSGKAAFASFAKSRCNGAFWMRTNDGGFRLKEGIQPAAAIRDIFNNGRLYAFECATAVVIVLYKGVLDTLGEEAFNRHFAGLYLHDWQYDSDLRLIGKKGTKDTYPGDVLYFKNPDYSPDTPEWQGENAIKLEEHLYFAHGIGLVTEGQVIAKLNRHRKPGSTQSAYLLEEVFYPDFGYLAQLSSAAAGSQSGDRPAARPKPALRHARQGMIRIGHVTRLM